MTQYNTNTQQVKIYDEVSSLVAVAPNLWEVDQCFGNETYQWLRYIPETQGNEFEVGWLKKRLELKRHTADYARLSKIAESMSNSLSTIVGAGLKLHDVKYWVDLPQFGCQTHSDAEEIFVSYQVYLYSALRDSSDWFGIPVQPTGGAEFLHVSPDVQIDFKPNHGYINLNSDLKPHRVHGTWDTRISVMFQYSRV